MSRQLKNRVIKSGLLIFVLATLTSPLGYFLRLIASRTLDPEMYGLLYAVIGLFGIFTIFNDLGFGYSVSYFVPKFLQKSKYSKVWNLYYYDQIIEVASAIIISAIMLMTADWWANYFFKVPQVKVILPVFCVYFIANSVVSALQKFFTGLQSVKHFASVEPVRILFTLIAVLLVWKFQYNSVLFYSIAWTVGYVLVAVLYLWLLNKSYGHTAKKISWDAPLLSSMFAFAIPSLLTTSLTLLMNYTDTFFLTLFRNVLEVGVYNVVFPLAAISSILISPIQSMVLPLVSQLSDKKPNKVNVLIHNVLMYIPLATLFFGIFTSFYAREIIRFSFGEKWEQVAYLPLQVLSLGFLFILLSSFLGTITSGLGQVKQKMKVIAVIASLNIILGGVFTYLYGIWGTIFSQLLLQLLACVCYVMLIRKAVVFQIPIKAYFKILITSGLAFSGLYLVRFIPTSLTKLVFAGLAYSAGFFVLVLIFRLLDIKQVRTVFKI